MQAIELAQTSSRVKIAIFLLSAFGPIQKYRSAHSWPFCIRVQILKTKAQPIKGNIGKHKTNITESAH
jgi:hypothetical protein